MQWDKIIPWGRSMQEYELMPFSTIHLIWQFALTCFSCIPQPSFLFPCVPCDVIRGFLRAAENQFALREWKEVF